jgi:hypothetical protein
MAYENNAGLGVNNQYGARETGGAVGVETSDNSNHSLSISITGDMLNGTFIPPVVIPKGARFTSAILRVDEAFTIGGTTPTVRFGAAGSVATNGIVLSEAELEAVGTKAPASTGAGTWAFNSATGTTAAAKVAFDMGGTSPTATPGVGKATLILNFVNKTKV